MPQDAPLPFFWAVVMWLIRLVLWPFCIYDVIFQRDPLGVAFVVMLLLTVLFWGFIIELVFMAKSRLRPKPDDRLQISFPSRPSRDKKL